MIANAAAQPLLDFISSHGLSMRLVAKTAKISEGAIRNFRDIKGRVLEQQTRISIGRALHLLTLENIDIVELFSIEEDYRYFSYVNHHNKQLRDILILKKISPINLSKSSRVTIESVVRILYGLEIDGDDKNKLENYLGIKLSEHGVRQDIVPGIDVMDIDALHNLSAKPEGWEADERDRVEYMSKLEERHCLAEEDAGIWWRRLVDMLKEK